jgi:hypothetical protein
MLSPLSTAALNAVARERSGLASSVANTTRQTGNVIGIALPATLPVGYSAARLHQIAASAYVTGIHGSYAVGGIVLLAAAAVVAFRPARSAAPAMSADPVSLDSVAPDRGEPAVAAD